MGFINDQHSAPAAGPPAATAAFKTVPGQRYADSRSHRMPLMLQHRRADHGGATRVGQCYCKCDPGLAGSHRFSQQRATMRSDSRRAARPYINLLASQEGRRWLWCARQSGDSTKEIACPLGTDDRRESQVGVDRIDHFGQRFSHDSWHAPGPVRTESFPAHLRPIH